MDISKETFEKADTDTKLSMIFDYVKPIHDCIKGNNGIGLSEEVRNIKAAQSRLRKILFGGAGSVATALGIRGIAKFFGL